MQQRFAFQGVLVSSASVLRQQCFVRSRSPDPKILFKYRPSPELFTQDAGLFQHSSTVVAYSHLSTSEARIILSPRVVRHAAFAHNVDLANKLSSKDGARSSEQRSCTSRFSCDASHTSTSHEPASHEPTHNDTAHGNGANYANDGSNVLIIPTICNAKHGILPD